MTDSDAIKATQGDPATVDTIHRDLVALGVSKGMVLLVHSSLSSIGWVCGGPVAVVQALERALNDKGTLVMPTYSSDLSEPSYWRHPPVPEAWWPIIRQSMPAFDHRLTPTRDVGAIPECFRNQEGTRRSSHPSFSFSARGPDADSVTANHSLDFPAGDRSPLARIYDLHGSVLLLGASFQCASSIHLAEYRAQFPGKRVTKQGAPLIIRERREWVEFDDYDFDDSDFTAIGTSFSEMTGLARSGKIGNATAYLLPQRDFVDYAVGWIEKNRH